MGEVSRACPSLPKILPLVCPFLSPVGTFCCPLLPAASLMLKCKKCPKMLRSVPQLRFRGRHPRPWDSRMSPCCPRQTVLALVP